MVAVLFCDDVVSFLTTPPPPPHPRHTLSTRRCKRTVSDPSNSPMVMLWCRLNRLYFTRAVAERTSSDDVEVSF